MFKYQVIFFSMATGSIIKKLGSYSSMKEALASVKSAAGIRLDSVPIELITNGLQIYPGTGYVIQVVKEAVLAA